MYLDDCPDGRLQVVSLGLGGEEYLNRVSTTRHSLEKTGGEGGGGIDTEMSLY